MKKVSLAAQYRPQNFAEVAGQDLVKTVLSRAAAEDRVAPAYLFSGTRGVGKTTLARIFAKTLNCQNAPTGDPCNQCEQCRKVTQGIHVDVAEIDGASNNSVEDARALRENIGYAPMEGRYKIFIIDEAHMLSRSAFNALLKTLEEPPARVVFILATTEAHKFPATIISRCQHFIFKHLAEADIVAHLTRVLQSEKATYEEEAVRLIARRANGSVRDGMSLLDQALALGTDLSATSTRAVLGLAGQDMLTGMLDALAAQDCGALVTLLRSLLNQGVDISFFLREFAWLWRTLFLLREGREAILPALDLTEDDACLWLSQASRFSAAHLHAAWQMTLDAQRRIAQTPEPSAALELLLVNIAMLPRLLPLSQFDTATEAQSASAPSHSENTTSAAPQSTSAPVRTPPPSAFRAASAATTAPEQDAPPAAMSQTDSAPRTSRAPARRKTATAQDSEGEKEESDPASSSDPSHTQADIASIPAPSLADAGGADADAPPATPWTAFCAYCASARTEADTLPPQPLLKQLCATLTEHECHLSCTSSTQYTQLNKCKSSLERLLRDFHHNDMTLRISNNSTPHKSESQHIKEFAQKEELQPCLKILHASITRCTPLKSSPKQK